MTHDSSRDAGSPAGRPTGSEGYRQAVDLLRRCITEHGFVASPTRLANYRRIWGRDGAIIGLAALLSGDDELRECCRRTLVTLADHQGPHGEIPSNVDPWIERVSYGGTAGRVDSDLWFIIACGEYWRRTRDETFLQRMIRPLAAVRHLLGSWEFNNRGLLYVPPTGDWADEYLQSGYVLYDQLLYLAAQRTMGDIHEHMHGSDDHELAGRISRLEGMIRANFWFREDDETESEIYHRVMYEKGRAAAPHRSGSYWMPFFSPFGYGYRFDALANVMASLLGVADEEQAGLVDAFIDDEVNDESCLLLPAFWPVVMPQDDRWDELQTTYSDTFKNSPYEFHNGGRWPMVTGFYVAALARRGLGDRAEKYLAAIDGANGLPMDGEPWSFPEFIHGRKYTPGGTSPLGWSAAAAVIGRKTVAGERIFTGRLDPASRPEANRGKPVDPASGN